VRGRRLQRSIAATGNGDAHPLLLLDSDVRRMEDRLAIRYRLRGHEDRWYVGEQQVYCEVRDGQNERLDLPCSGFRPETLGSGA
jgi:hypothetical protein